MPFSRHLNIFFFGRGVIDHKIRHLSGEFRRTNLQKFKGRGEGGLPRGWDFEALK